MTIETTKQQNLSIVQGEPLHLKPDNGAPAAVILSEAEYEAFEEDLRDEIEHRAFRKLAKKARSRLARENPY